VFAALEASMEITTTNLVLIALLLTAAVVIGYFVLQARRREAIKSHFGAEYDRVVEDEGSKRRAERELHAREKRVESFNLRPLEPADRTRFMTAWTGVQAAFVDDPANAIEGADRLLAEVMRLRGYPITDFDQRAADLSVQHGEVIENYRTAHDIYESHRRGDAGTEDLRHAMLCYRELFEDLVGDVNGDRPKMDGRDDRRPHIH